MSELLTTLMSPPADTTRDNRATLMTATTAAKMSVAPATVPTAGNMTVPDSNLRFAVSFLSSEREEEEKDEDSTEFISAALKLSEAT